MRYVMTFNEIGKNKGIADGMEIVGETGKSPEDEVKIILEGAKSLKIGTYQDDGDDCGMYRMYSRSGGVFWDDGVGGDSDVHYEYKRVNGCENNKYELEAPGRRITVEFDKACLNSKIEETVGDSIIYSAQYAFKELKIL